MKNIFGENGWLYRIITRMVDLALLNVVFLITCIPIITIGTAITALYTVTMKMCKNEEAYIIRSYLCYFRENFKKATMIWGILFVVLGIILGDFWALRILQMQISDMLRVVITAVLLLWIILASYVFPLAGKFENSVKHTMKNAWIIAVTRLPYTILIVCINLIPAVLALYGGIPLLWGIRIYLFVGFAFAAFVNSFLFVKVFERYISEE